MILAGGLALILVLGTWLLFLQNKESEITPVPSPSPSISSSTDNWKTFVNISNNYLVKYPSDEEGPTMFCGGMLMHFNPAESCYETGFSGARYQVMAYPSILSFEELVSYLTKRGTVENKKSTEIAGKQAFELMFKGWLNTTASIDENGELTSGGQLYDDRQKIYYLKLSDKEYMTIQYSLEICEEQTPSGLFREIPCKPRGGSDLTEKVISTLSFFDKTELDSLINKYWKQYKSDRLGFELKIPPPWGNYSSKPGDYFVFSSDQKLTDDEIVPGEDRYYLDLAIQVANKEIDLYKTSPVEYKIARKTSVDFAGQKAVKTIYFPLKRGYIDDFPTEIVFNKAGKWWMIRYLSDDKNGSHNPVFDKILTSFKLLDKTESF